MKLTKTFKCATDFGAYFTPKYNKIKKYNKKYLLKIIISQNNLLLNRLQSLEKRILAEAAETPAIVYEMKRQVESFREKLEV